MKIIRRSAALTAMLAAYLSLGSLSAHAKNLTYSDLSARIEALENELSSQKVQLASCDSSDSCCGGGGGSAYGAAAARSSWYVGYELTVLRPYISNANTGSSFDDEFGFGHRLVLGYNGGSGMGARLRYWFYNHGQDILAGAGAGTSVGLDMDVLDLEITLSEQLRNWGLMATGGFRYGRVGLTNTGLFGTGEIFFEGAGPTVSLEATRGFGDRNLYLIGNARTSLLFGDLNNYSLAVPASKVDNELTTVFESQLGVGYTRDLGGAILTLRTVWETQFWMNDTFADEFNGAGSNLGFAGPTSTIELRF